MIFSITSTSSAAVTISNFAEIRRGLGIESLTRRVQDGRTVRVAILDKAFTKVRAEFGRTLPAGTRYIPGKIPAPAELTSDHGVRMAQMVTALVTEDLRYPKRLDLRLYNAFGFTISATPSAARSKSASISFCIRKFGSTAGISMAAAS